MKERPILFSAPMVKSILDGTKNQTRRIVKGDWSKMNHAEPLLPKWISEFPGATAQDWLLQVKPGELVDGEFQPIGCPHGRPGDRLWVRETWGLTGRAANSRLSDFSDPDLVLKDNLIHRAGCDGYDESTQHWRPSIHMPRWASRINLEITGVRVERLQDISEADAKAEGIHSIPFYPDDGFPLCDGWTWLKDDGKSPLYNKPSAAYKALWESINSTGSWDKNPWVWVIEFRRLN